MHTFGSNFDQRLQQIAEGASVTATEEVQVLWSGYGQIVRVNFDSYPSVIVKHVKPPTSTSHPRGWNSSTSHQRKVRSYQVETNWYLNWSQQCSSNCRVPTTIDIANDQDEVFIVLEDLYPAGFNQVKSSITWDEIQTCLRWLANFHATYLSVKPEGLWPIGTYWHLDTRRDEFDALDSDDPLKTFAGEIDAALNNSSYKTLVHGDAKLANFLFKRDGNDVAAVDFQYVGGGCGMKDLAYFVGSCLNDTDSEAMEQDLLSAYFNQLRIALSANTNDLDIEALIAEWTKLYPVAWADFHRFLKGWSPGHWKINSYSDRMTKQALEMLS